MKIIIMLLNIVRIAFIHPGSSACAIPSSNAKYNQTTTTDEGLNKYILIMRWKQSLGIQMDRVVLYGFS